MPRISFNSGNSKLKETVFAHQNIYKDTLHGFSLLCGDYLISIPQYPNKLSPSAMNYMENRQRASVITQRIYFTHISMVP